MKSFGLVTEGITDQEILINIVSGFFRNNDIPFRVLQPLFNASGGWTKVLDYCGNLEFRQAFGSLDYIIIHIDTDTAEEYGVSHREAGAELSPQALAQRVVDR